jgi:hypothetical protein
MALLAELIVLSVASALIGAIIEYCLAAMHHHHHHHKDDP